MADHRHHAAVVALLREVAAEVVMPRFRHLAADDIEHKAADDLVTVADREAEIRLADGLAAIDADARFVGEEACAADPSMMDGIDVGRVWIVDPIDGTNNYAVGRSPFALMVALAEDGVVRAGWMFDPVLNRLCHAARGGGARIDGQGVVARGSGLPRPIAALSHYVPADQRERIDEHTRDRWTPAAIPRCAGEQYSRLVAGQNDIALFHRILPWDHAAGVLFLEEAGGKAARLNGRPYHVGDLSTGLLAASTPALWEEAAGLLA